MKSMYSLLFLFSISILFSSCKEEKQTLEVTALLTGFSEHAEVTLIDGVSSKNRVTTKLKNGQFTLTDILSKTPTSLQLLITEKDNSVSALSLFVGNEKIAIRGDKENFPNGLQITGSSHQTLKSTLEQETAFLNEKYDKEIQSMIVQRQANTWNDSLQNVYWGKGGVFEVIDADILKITQKFIEKNINTHYALKELNRNKNNFSKTFIENQLKQIQPKFEKIEYVQVLNTFLNNKPLAANDFLYDFEAENKEGKVVQFSDHFDDKKYVLLEFTSPYCGWCKKALPEIKKLVNLKSEVLTVVTLNVENDKKDWIKTSKENNVAWENLWNEKGRNSDAFTKYRVAGTPTYVLFDKEGKMIKKWTGYDESLILNIKKHLTS